MAKKISRSRLIKQLDTIFSQYVRLKNIDKQGYTKCVTCGKKGHWKNSGMQAGHFMSRKHYATRWDINNVHVQCTACNMFRQGEQYKFSLYLGNELSESLYKKSRKIVKYSNNDLKSMISEYKELVKSIIF